MKFYLGTHEPSWLSRTDVPLFVSHHRLMKRKNLPRALGPWALDSGAFTVVSGGEHFEPPAIYAKAVKRYADEIGGLEWCAPQDWMCEPFVLERTGYGLANHQRLTLHSYLDLTDDGAPVIPVLQGWRLADYHRHADQYENCGIALDTLPVVGVGSVCRRQSTSEIEAILTSLNARGYRLHGFGVKAGGLARYSHALTSADSLAWSYAARMAGPQEDCPHGRPVPLHLQDVAGTDARPGGTCANCLRFALRWRDALLASGRPQQLSLGVAA